MKQWLVLSFAFAFMLACLAPVSAEGERVPAINIEANKAVIVSKTALAETPVFQLAEVVVEVADGALFLLTSGGGPEARQIFLNALYAELKEQLHVGAIITNYEDFSVAEVAAATAEQVEPIIKSFINGYIVRLLFMGGSAYSFAW